MRIFNALSVTNKLSEIEASSSWGKDGVYCYESSEKFNYIVCATEGKLYELVGYAPVTTTDTTTSTSTTTTYYYYKDIAGTLAEGDLIKWKNSSGSGVFQVTTSKNVSIS